MQCGDTCTVLQKEEAKIGKIDRIFTCDPNNVHSEI